MIFGMPKPTLSEVTRAPRSGKVWAQRRAVWNGNYSETAGGLTKDNILRVKRGTGYRYLSKKRSNNGKANEWAKATKKARASLKITGFFAMNASRTKDGKRLSDQDAKKSRELYKTTLEIYNDVMEKKARKEGQKPFKRRKARPQRLNTTKMMMKAKRSTGGKSSMMKGMKRNAGRNASLAAMKKKARSTGAGSMKASSVRKRNAKAKSGGSGSTSTSKKSIGKAKPAGPAKTAAATKPPSKGKSRGSAKTSMKKLGKKAKARGKAAQVSKGNAKATSGGRAKAPMKAKSAAKAGAAHRAPAKSRAKTTTGAAKSTGMKSKGVGRKR